MAKGFHLFPYRTQKLRPSAPKVLGWTRPGRIGRRRIPFEDIQLNVLFFYALYALAAALHSALRDVGEIDLVNMMLLLNLFGCDIIAL